jgi:hypothetical protein
MIRKPRPINPGRVGLEFRLERLFERDRLGGDHMLEGPALGAGKDRLVDGLAERFDRQNQAAAGAAKGLVGGGGDDLRVRHRRRMSPARDQAGEMGHVDQQRGPDLVGHRPERLEVDDSGIRAAAADDQLRLLLHRLGPDLIHLDPPGVRIDPVVDGVPDRAAVVDPVAV